jgi:hypothetical protein
MPFLMRVIPRQEQARPDHGVGTGSVVAAMDRRQEPRCCADGRQSVSAQLLGGVDVRLRNVSTRGVMFESSMRVVVGAHVTLRLRTAARTVLLPGKVVRSRVLQGRHGRLRYETALQLESDCPLTNEELTRTLRPQTPVVSVVDVNVVDVEVVEAEPIQTGPVQAAPVQAGPIQAGPVESRPTHAENLPVVVFANDWGTTPRS